MSMPLLALKKRGNDGIVRERSRLPVVIVTCQRGYVPLR